MAFRKIKAGLVKGDVEQFVGEIGNLFFDIDTGILRLSDGVTLGGSIVSGGSGGSGFSGAYADLSGKPTVVSAFTNDAGYLTSSSLSSYATQSYVTSRGYITSSALPTAVSQLTNDSNFLTGSNFDLNTIDYDSNNKLHATGILPGDADGFTAIFAGRAAGIAALPNTVIQSQAQVNGYAQNNFQNTYDGNHSSTEWVATSPNGDDSNYYIDLGINGASWDGTAENSLYTNVGQRDGWVYVQGGNAGGGNLVLGTSLSNTYTKIISGDASAGDIEVARFSSTEVKLQKQLTFNDNTTQTTAYPGPPDLSSYATQTYVTEQGYITIADLPNLSGYATKTGEETLTNKTLTSPTLTDPTFTGTFAFESTNTTQPAMTLTASSLQDGVGILRVIGSEPDINFNQVSESPGFNTFTFEWNGDPKLAMGRRNDHSFYITRNYDGWQDDTFVLDYTTGVLSVPAGIATGSIDFGEAGIQTEPFLGFGSLSLGDMGDVDLTTAPTIGQVLKFDGTKWAPGTDITAGGSGTDADTLDGFDSTYFLNYNNFTNKPSLATVATSGSYTDLTNKPTIPTTVTVNGTSITLGSSGTITANTTNALTIGYGLTGTSTTFTGSAANTVALDTSTTAVTATSGGTLTLSAATMTRNYVVTGGATGGTYTIKFPDLTTLNVGQQITFYTTASLIAWQLSTGTAIITNANSGSIARATTFTVISTASNSIANLAFTAVPTTGSTVGTGTALVTNTAPFISSLGANTIDNGSSTLVIGATTTSTTIGATTGAYTQTINVGTSASGGAFTKTLNLGTNLAGGTSVINIGTGVSSGTATVNIGSSTTTATMNGAVTITSLTATNSIVGSITGNAATATKLGTARAINGINFDGSAAITITAANPNALTIGSGLSGTSYDGGTAVTIAVDSTVALRADTTYIGTTSIALNRTSASQTLTGVSIDGNAGTVTNGVYTTGTYSNPAWITSLAGSKVTNAVLTTDTGTVTNTMLAGSIANAKLSNSSVTVGTTTISLGASSTTLAGLTSVTSTGFTGALTGNASTATKLATARNINSVSFDGSADISVSSLVNGSYSLVVNSDGTITQPNGALNTGTAQALLWSTNTLGSGLTYRAASGGVGLPFQGSAAANSSGFVITQLSGIVSNLTSKIWTFDWSGNLTYPDATVQSTAYTATAAKALFSASNASASGSGGSLSYSNGVFTFTPALNITGNAATATKLATARNINSVSFDGSADITVTAAAGTLTGTTLNSTVVSSSLTSLGTLTQLVVSASSAGNAASITANTWEGLKQWTFVGASNSAISPSSWIQFPDATKQYTAYTGNAATVTNGVYTTDTGTVTNTMLAGSIANAKLANSSITVNGTSISLGSSATVTAAAGTLTGTTLNSTVVTSSLTSLGTLTGLTSNGAVTVNYIGTGTNGSVHIRGLNDKGGTAYHDFLSVTNEHGSATNPNKYFRLSPTGVLEIRNSIYDTTIFSLSDAGAVNIGGNLAVTGNINSTSGSYQIGGTYVINSNSLGSGVTASSLTSVGTLTSLNTSGSVTANATTAFIAGASAVSNVSLQMPSESAIRNLTNGATNMYFDVSNGGSTNGQFQFRSSSSYTNVLTMSPTAVSFNTDATFTSRTPSVARTAFNSAIDTEITLDNMRFRISNQGGIFPQVIGQGSSRNLAWTGVGALNGTSIAQMGSTGAIVSTSAWTTLYSSHGMDAAGDTITVTLQDKAAGRIYRITFVRSDNGSTTGYNIIGERIL